MDMNIMNSPTSIAGTITGTGPQQQNEENSVGTRVAIQRQTKAWYRGICIMQTCHSDFANKYSRADKIVTLIEVALTAITSSMIFTSISPTSQGGASEEDVAYNNMLATFAGIMAASNAVVQALHKALALAEGGERHTAAYKQFTTLRFRLERLTCGNFEEDGSVLVDEDKLAEWAHDYGRILESAPIVPQTKFDAVRRREMEKERIYFNPNRQNESNYNRGGKRMRWTWTLNPLAKEPRNNYGNNNYNNDNVQKPPPCDGSLNEMERAQHVEKSRLVGGSY